ncbi:MAG TPA: SRPBCC domain-containing protein [Myxococcaceae bacterium]|nr:SRPBCC domain-containing protein [Myxococcaceae bacterium]
MPEIEPITMELTLKASPERVYDAYTLKSELELWFAQQATISAEAGGRWRYTWPGEMAAEGRILEAERPHHLVWSWEKSIQGEHEVASQVVNTYTFEAVEGGTRMRLVESQHDSRAMRDMSVGGIEQMLVTLRAFLEEGTVVDWDALSQPG